MVISCKKHQILYIPCFLRLARTDISDVSGKIGKSGPSGNFFEGMLSLWYEVKW